MLHIPIQSIYWVKKCHIELDRFKNLYVSFFKSLKLSNQVSLNSSGLFFFPLNQLNNKLWESYNSRSELFWNQRVKKRVSQLTFCHAWVDTVSRIVTTRPCRGCGAATAFANGRRKWNILLSSEWKLQPIIYDTLNTKPDRCVVAALLRFTV